MHEYQNNQEPDEHDQFILCVLIAFAAALSFTVLCLIMRLAIMQG